MATNSKTVLRLVKRWDRLARWVITAGGIIVIASVIAILLLIFSVALPLFTPARSTVVAAGGLAPSAAPPVALGVDLVELSREAGASSVTAFAIDRDGGATFFDCSAGIERETGAADFQPLGRTQLDPPHATAGQTVECAVPLSGADYLLQWSGGGLTVARMDIASQFSAEGKRSVSVEAKTRLRIPPDDAGKPRVAIVHPGKEGAFTSVKALPNGRLVMLRYAKRENMLTGEVEEDTKQIELQGVPNGSVVTTLAINGDGTALYAGTADGRLVRWEFNDAGAVVFQENTVAFPDGRAITALALAYGDLSLLVGDAQGGLSVWFEVREHETRHLRHIRDLAGHSSPVRAIVPSQRNRTILSLDEDGVASLDYTTSGRHLLDLQAEQPLRLVGYSPRGNAVIGLDASQQLHLWQIECPHADVSWNTLFAKVHYESYAQPEHKWQSEGHEPKHGLMPIIFGTLKATLYAMCFAIPLALFGAVYVSHFTTPGFRGAIKPVVEVMAALPSVVIGFLILLWAAPLLARSIVVIFAALVTIPASFFGFMAIWQMVRRFDWAKRVEHGYEFLVLTPVVCLGAAAAVWAAPWIETTFFAGDVRQWLYTAGWTQWWPQSAWSALFGTSGVQYEQLNATVVAIGLGFAVIPIIFSISEDALSNIPHSLTAASLALGASRWQTLWRVILPSASPGIFAAVMIGFGRAVGETMIVFMAAGNTANMDLSPFNGFRTLAANIAVEMPESSAGESLYRILFLCAVILFVMTFLLNTAAEVVRQRLRKRYGRY